MLRFAYELFVFFYQYVARCCFEENILVSTSEGRSGGMDIDSKLRTLCILINLSLSHGLCAIAITLTWFCVRIGDYRVLRMNSI